MAGGFSCGEARARGADARRTRRQQQSHMPVDALFRLSFLLGALWAVAAAAVALRAALAPSSTLSSRSSSSSAVAVAAWGSSSPESTVATLPAFFPFSLFLLPVAADQPAPVPSYFATPRQSNGIDARAPAGPLFFSIVSPASMVSTVRYSVCYDSPSLVDSLVGVRLSLPASVDDISGCSALTSPTADDGSSLNGTVLLLIGGACATADQYANAQAVGAVAWINTFPAEAPDVYTSWAANPPAGGAQTSPYVIITYNDALVIANWLRLNPATPLLMNMVGAGRNIMHAGDRAVLTQFATKLDASLAGGYEGDCDNGSCGNLRSLKDVLRRPDLDPCTYRVGAIWCVNGRVVGLIFKSNDALSDAPYGSVDFDLIGQWSELALINMGTSAMPSNRVGPGFCNLHKLAVVALYSMGLSSIPDCFHGMPGLVFLNIGANYLSHFPSSAFNGSCPQLGVARLQGQNGAVMTFPAGVISAANSPRLSHLIMDAAGLTGNTLPDLRGMQFLQQVKLNNNFFTVSNASGSSSGSVSPAIQSTYFDGLIRVEELSLASNSLSMPVPTLVGASRLQTLTLASNSFSGPLPSSWRLLSALVTLDASHNLIESPISALGGLLYIRALDLSWNALQTKVGVPEFDQREPPSFDVFLTLSISSVLERLNLAHNQLRGDFNSLYIAPHGLTILDLSHNSISQFGDTLFLAPVNLAQLDLSFNALEGEFPGTSPQPTLLVLNVQGNPLFKQSYLPSWLTTDDSNQVKAVGTSFVCSSVVGTTSAMLVTLDASFSSYEYCSCDASYFGTSPNCIPIPDSAAVGVQPYLSVASAPNYTRMWADTTTSLSRIDPLNIASEDMVVFARNSTLAVSDALYGSKRLSTGLNTRWLLSAAQIVGQEARVVNLVLYVNTAVFTGSSNLITISSGDLSANRQYVFSIRGDETDRLAAATVRASNTSSASTTLPFGIGSTALFTVQVFDTDAVVQFQSRATSLRHFELEYFFSLTCPRGYEANPAFVGGLEADACLPLDLCGPSLLTWSRTPCDETQLTSRVSFAYSGPCLPSDAYTLPDPESITCEYAPVSHASSVILIVMVSVMILGLVAVGLVLSLRHGHGHSSLLIARFLGGHTYVTLLATACMLAMYFCSLGHPTPMKCSARLYLLMVGVSLLVSSMAIALYKRGQQLSLSFFNPNSLQLQRKCLAFLVGFVALNVLILILGDAVASDSDGSKQLRTASWSLSTQSESGASAQVLVSVCAPPSLWVSATLLVVNVGAVLGTVLLNVQVLWLATLNRDRLMLHLTATRARMKAAGGKAGTRKKALQQQLSATKQAIIGVLQLKSVLIALCTWSLALLVLLLATFLIWADSPARLSQAQGSILLALGLAVVVPLFAYSMWYHHARKSLSMAAAAAAAANGGNGKSVRHSQGARVADGSLLNPRSSEGGGGVGGGGGGGGAGGNDVHRYAEEDDELDDVAVEGSSKSPGSSSDLSFSMTRNSHTNNNRSMYAGGYGGGGGHGGISDPTKMRGGKDAWEQMLAVPSASVAANLFDAQNNSRSNFEAVVSMLQDPVALLHLRSFAQASFQAESINFIIRVQQFIHATRGAAPSTAPATLAAGATTAVASGVDSSPQQQHQAQLQQLQVGVHELTPVEPLVPSPPTVHAPSSVAPSSSIGDVLPSNSFGALLLELLSMYQTFIATGSADQINVATEQRMEVEAALASLHLSAVRLAMGEPDLSGGLIDSAAAAQHPSGQGGPTFAQEKDVLSMADPIGHHPHPLAAKVHPYAQKSSLGLLRPHGPATTEVIALAPIGPSSPTAQAGGNGITMFTPSTTAATAAATTAMTESEPALPGVVLLPSAALASAFSASSSSSSPAVDTLLRRHASFAGGSQHQQQSRSSPASELVLSLSMSSFDGLVRELHRAFGFPLDMASALCAPAPALFFRRCVDVWRACSLEAMMLITQNTFVSFQESAHAAAANSQLAFCDRFDEFTDDEQRAIMERWAKQMTGRGEAVPQLRQLTAPVFSTKN